MMSDSILYKILTSGDVNTFEETLRALPERPEKLRLRFIIRRTTARMSITLNMHIQSLPVARRRAVVVSSCAFIMSIKKYR